MGTMHSLFKEDYSVTKEASEPEADESIDVNMAGLSLTSSMGDGSALHISSPGPSNATVQTIKREVTHGDESPQGDSDDINAQHSRAMSEHRPSIVALKMSLKEVAEAAAAKRKNLPFRTINNVMDSQRSSISSSRDEIFVDASPSPVVTRTASIDIPRSEDGRRSNNRLVNSKPYLYNYEPSGVPVGDPDGGMLQGTDVVLNQELLEQALKRDMKRKRADTMQSSTVELNKKVDTNTSKNSNHTEIMKNPPETAEPTSATAAMMMRLYGDRTLLNQQITKQKEDENKYSHTITNAAYKKLKPFSGVKRKILSNPNLNLQPLEPIRPNEPATSGQRTPNNSAHVHSESPSPDRTNVILKWRDSQNQSNNKELKVYLVSNEICASLKNDDKLFAEGKLLANDNSQFNKIPLSYDSHNNEWYVPDLYLPQGIYRLQFLVNGNLVHSDFLPTATDDQGNIMNWFEVLRGYDRIEPYRDESEIQSDYTSSVDTTLEGMENNGFQGSSDNSTTSMRNNNPVALNLQAPAPSKAQASRNSSYYSAKSFEKSITQFSDYTGVSRTNSMVSAVSPINNANTRDNDLEFFPPIKPKVYEYSNNIPALFRISGDMEDMDDDNGTENNPRAFYDRPSFTNRVVDCNQDALFGDLQKGGKMDAEEAENLFLKKYQVPDLPVYLNSTYLNKIFHEFHQVAGPSTQDSSINHIIPHVNLKHLLTSSIRDGIVSVACTTRYAGKFITQVIYAPCGNDQLESKE